MKGSPGSKGNPFHKEIGTNGGGRDKTEGVGDLKTANPKT